MRTNISRTPRSGRPNGALLGTKPMNRPAAVEPLERRQLLSTVVVNTTADSTDAKGSSTVSLRDAIAVANSATSATTITFSPTVFATAKTITLGGTQLELSNTKEATTITGPASGLTISGNNRSRVLQVDSMVTASLSGIVISHGNVSGSGGGVNNAGNLTLVSCSIIQNTSSGAGSTAGGILSTGNLSCKDVSISANVGRDVGGLYEEATGQSTTVELVDVTIANNSVTTLYAGGASFEAYNGFTDNVSLTDVTVADNSAPVYEGGIGFYSPSGSKVAATFADVTVAGNNGGGKWGGVAVGSSSVTLAISNSIIAGNTATSQPDVFGPFSSKGHNLISKTDGSTGWTSADYTGTVAKPLAADLGSLANNGGPTETLLPLTGSPAIDKGSNSLIPRDITTDQRGLPRIYNGTVDIGAVEVQPLIQITAPGSQTATVNVSKSVTLGSFAQYTSDAPYKDLITWGDGSASTTLSLTAAGTIPATAHAFAKTGTITVTEVITDAQGNKSNTVTFAVTVTGAVGSISGLVFDDTNANGKQDKGEVGLGLFTVYLDINNDGKLDTGDKSTTTDIHGNFSFTGLAAGTYYLRIVPDTIDTATTPTLIKVVLTAGEIASGNLFGEN